MSNSYAAVHLAEFLAEVRASQRVVVTRYASPAALQASLEKVARMMMNREGVSRVQFLAGIRLTHVLAPAFRKLCGPALARELVRIWRHWGKMGMEPGLAEVLTCGLYRAMAAREKGRVVKCPSVRAEACGRVAKGERRTAVHHA
jgi:hypothetical protein